MGYLTELWGFFFFGIDVTNQLQSFVISVLFVENTILHTIAVKQFAINDALLKMLIKGKLKMSLHLLGDLLISCYILIRLS
jgi:hypothetical protein